MACRYIHHGMLPDPVESGSYLFIPYKPARPKPTPALVPFLRVGKAWQDYYKGYAICANDTEYPCEMISMSMEDGVQFKGEKGSYTLKGDEWVSNGRRLNNGDSIHYPEVTSPCPELPAGTELYRYVSPGKWRKQTLLTSGDWEDKECEFCKKRELCGEKLPVSPMTGDTLQSPVGLTIQYSYKDGWVKFARMLVTTYYDFSRATVR